LEDGKNKLVVADTGWAQDIPDWLLEEVKCERLLLGLEVAKENQNGVGNAEACAYLFTRSLAGPMSSELTDAYIYLTAKLMKRRGMMLPEFMKKKLEQGLIECERRELNNLKQTLYQKRGGEIGHPIITAMRALKNNKPVTPPESRKVCRQGNLSEF